ncbi:MAG: hypothetical protein HFF39_11675 [Lawsonibacter sp.]|nr:hypothetical protein [Lawsonibacter sp.]
MDLESLCLRYDKIMAGRNLEDIVDRLDGCLALLYALQEIQSTITNEALYGIIVLLEVIRRDFIADVDRAEDYIHTQEVPA